MSPDPQDDKKDSAEHLDNELLFTQLVLSFQAAAWQQMGKVPSIITGNVERNLEMAKHSIDMLGMLEERTKGNLSENELKYLERTLFELRMNYLDELRKGPDRKEEKKEEPLRNAEEPPKSEAPPPADDKK